MHDIFNKKLFKNLFDDYIKQKAKISYSLFTLKIIFIFQ